MYIIHEGASIKKRNIMDGVFSLHELMNHTHIKKYVWIVLKLDFKKVYDKLNWEFLLSRNVAKGLCVICGAIGQNKTSIMALSLLN
jgi:type IV secretory pathway ATPase VirB11/archaellum biosynthesis ATPase